MLAGFRETIPTVKSVSSSEIQRINLRFLTEITILQFFQKLEFLGSYNPSTCGKSIRLVSRDPYLSKIATWAPASTLFKTYPNYIPIVQLTKSISNQIYYMVQEFCTFLLIQIHIKTYNSNTYYPKTSKPQPDFLQNRSLRRAVFSNTPVPEKMFP